MHFTTIISVIAALSLGTMPASAKRRPHAAAHRTSNAAHSNGGHRNGLVGVTNPLITDTGHVEHAAFGHHRRQETAHGQDWSAQKSGEGEVEQPAKKEARGTKGAAGRGALFKGKNRHGKAQDGRDGGSGGQNGQDGTSA